MITVEKYVCLVAQSCLTLCDTMDYKSARLLCSWGFSRQEYWSELPCPPPGDLPNPGLKPRSLALQADSLQSELLEVVFVKSPRELVLFNGINQLSLHTAYKRKHYPFFVTSY